MYVTCIAVCIILCVWHYCPPSKITQILTKLPTSVQNCLALGKNSQLSCTLLVPRIPSCKKAMPWVKFPYLGLKYPVPSKMLILEVNLPALGIRQFWPAFGKNPVFAKLPGLRQITLPWAKLIVQPQARLLSLGQNHSALWNTVYPSCPSIWVEITQPLAIFQYLAKSPAWGKIAQAACPLVRYPSHRKNCLGKNCPSMGKIVHSQTKSPRFG